MAHKKITALPALGGTPATVYVFPIVDVSGTATNKKVTHHKLSASAPQRNFLPHNNFSNYRKGGTSMTS